LFIFIEQQSLAASVRRAIDLAISLKDNVEEEMGSLVRSIGGQFVAAGPVFIYTYACTYAKRKNHLYLLLFYKYFV